MNKQHLKSMPSLRSDAEAENFVDTVDLTEYDMSHFTTVNFAFQSKSTTLNMRLPQSLLNAVKNIEVQNEI